MNYTDEDLNALLDGELSSDELEVLQAALSEKPELAARLSELKVINAAYVNTYASIAAEPVPQSVLDLFKNDLSETGQASNVVELRPGENNKMKSTWFRRTSFAAAASVLFGIVLFSQFSQNKSIALAPGHVDANSKLHNVLESIESGVMSAGITPQLSFAALDGRYCREVLSSNSRALACRDTDMWTVLAVVDVSNKSSSKKYQTASADTQLTYDDLVNNMLKDAPLDKAAEKYLLENAWK